MGRTVNGDKRFSKVHIAREKITDYLLNKEHAIGRGKAKFFISLGFSPEKPGELEKALSAHPRTAEMREKRLSGGGTSYAFICDILAPGGEAFCIVSVWHVEQEGAAPRFVTAYPAKKQ